MNHQKLCLLFLIIVCFVQFFIIIHLSSNKQMEAKCEFEHIDRLENRSIKLLEIGNLITPKNECSCLSPIFMNKKVEKALEGVAVTFMLGSPKWFQNRFSVMINQIFSSLPDKWKIQIFYIQGKKMSDEAVNYNGIQRQVKKGNVILTPLHKSLIKLKKKDLLLNLWVWENMLAEKILLFGGNSVLCANSKWGLESIIQNQYDYIGSPWRMKQLKHQGGQGGLSFRSKSKVIDIIKRLDNNHNAGEGDDVLIVKAMLQNSSLKVASEQETYMFAMAGIMNDIRYSMETVGASGTLSTLNNSFREQFLSYCPELRMMFPTLHSPACFGANPKAIECFQVLCEYGGMKCYSNASMTYFDKNKKTRNTLSIHVIK